MLAYIIAGLIAVCVAVVFYHRTNPELSQRQRIGLAVLRAAVLAMLVIFLLTPIIYYIQRYRERPQVILLKDTSSSMQQQNPGKSRTEDISKAYDYLKTEYKKAGYIVKELVFADGLDGKPDKTFFIPALEQIRQKQGKKPLSKIILFSDGWFRDTDLRILKNYDVPIISVADTTQFRAVDLQVSDFRHNKNGYRNELSLLEATIKAVNYRGNARVKFIVDDKVVKEKTVSFQTNSNQTVGFDYRFAKTGLQKLEMRVSAQGINEVTLSNNNYLSAIDILSDKERILLFTDAPNWDTKFLLDTIRDNNRLEADSYTIKSGIIFSGDQRTSIKSWENVTSLIIVNQGGLLLENSLAASIISKVKQGTGLLFIGQPVQQLNDVLPLRQANIRSKYKGLFRLLPSAGAFSAFSIPQEELNQIPPVDYFYLNASAQAEILAVMDNAQQSPAIAFSSLWGGKVVSFSFLNLWRWQMQSKNQAYKSFTADVISWLSNKSAGEMTALYEPGYYLDEPIEIKLSAIDDIRRNRQNAAPRISVYNADNDSIFSDFMALDKDEYRIQFRMTKPDVYRFTITDIVTNQSASGRFLVGAQNLEARDLGSNISLLSWITAESKGRFSSLEEVSKLQPVKAIETDRIEKKEFPLYKKWYLICLFIIVFCLELFLRRRWGLL